MEQKLSIKDLDLKNKKILMRVDFNVPFDHGKITDDSRIKASIPTIQYALDHDAALILMSHLGRPKAKPDSSLSLTPCAIRLSELIKRPVIMAPDARGEEVANLAKNLKSGEVLLLENLRFHPGEEHPELEPSFASSLASLGDLYINDAFGSAHRAHASTVTIAEFFPGKAATGLLMEKEIEYLRSTLLNPKRPFCTILGGAKISTKFKVIEALMKNTDTLLIGGAMAFTFFKSEQIPVGSSLVEDDFLSVAREIIDLYTEPHSRIILPVDMVITQSIDSGISQVVDMKKGIPDGWMGVDIGPKTIELYRKEIKKAATIFWNGPVGVFEHPPYNKGTNAIAQALAEVQKGAITIVGGGDSAAAVDAAGLTDKISHLSTGGGASLEYIELGQLPGIEALSFKEKITHS